MILRRLFMSRLRRRVLANLDLAMSGAGYEPPFRTATPERVRFSQPVLPVSAPETGPAKAGGVALSSDAVCAGPASPQTFHRIADGYCPECVPDEERTA